MGKRDFVEIFIVGKKRLSSQLSPTVIPHCPSCESDPQSLVPQIVTEVVNDPYATTCVMN